MGMRIAIVGGILLLTMARAASADAWIESFTGDAGDYRIVRGDQPVGVAILGTLVPGDAVSVLAPDREIVIVYQTGEAVPIRSGEEPHVVSGSAEAPSAIQNLIRWSMDTIKGWYEKDYEMTRAAGVITRSTVSAITFPLFRGEGSWVGRRESMEISWAGGLPPYQVKLQRIDALVAADKIDANSTAIKVSNLAAGEYLLTVDDGWRRGSARFTVVPPEHIPAAPVAGVDADPRLRGIIEAMWLAQHEQGEYTLEAFQQLRALGEDYPPAKVATGALLKGLSPQEPASTPE
jgi:hypothetical protein